MVGSELGETRVEKSWEPVTTAQELRCSTRVRTGKERKQEIQEGHQESRSGSQTEAGGDRLQTERGQPAAGGGLHSKE